MSRFVFIPVIMSTLVLGAASCDRKDDSMARPVKPSSSGQVGTETTGAPSTTFAGEWFYSDQFRTAALRGIEGKPAAELVVKDWIGEPQKLADLKGKIVIVDFWGVWCPPCRAALPHNVEMADKYKDQGVVVIGIHTMNDAARMPDFAKTAKLNYPLSVDDDNKTAGAYQVSFFPTYVLIDRNGIVRAAGLLPGSVEKALDVLLEEAP